MAIYVTPVMVACNDWQGGIMGLLKSAWMLLGRNRSLGNHYCAAIIRILLYLTQKINQVELIGKIIDAKCFHEPGLSAKVHNRLLPRELDARVGNSSV